ncbi:EF-P 5-aminopentanol modification-associated protein YfmH [Hutsoniella sourekii]|uniref:EF-P 5-aminopentanol modification-associated protein YfmH n=1 Tax=Hutsoniella sourekii TaxID=87650 RepID=UPI000489FE36|nr:pitrilysin family protein [Hutsoniella sourekii]
MNKEFYPLLDETVYRYQISNGLHLQVLPKANYHRFYGVLSAKFGSLDRWLIDPSNDHSFEVPAGAAHFLEHKLFEGPNGLDAFSLFMKHGANANAFTSKQQTSYLFSGSYELDLNLKQLLDFVQTPSFTADGIEKEKGIILEEMKMYQDQPTTRLHQELMTALYPNHPLSEDIIGTAQSIQNMTYKDLMTAYQTFYHPENMSLMVVGAVNPAQIYDMVEKHQRDKTIEKSSLQVMKLDLPADQVDRKEISLRVSQPMLAIGLRMKPVDLSGSDLLKEIIIGQLFAELLLGPSSNYYHQWYEQDLIDDSFASAIICQDQGHYLLAIGTSKDPLALQKAIQEAVSTWQDSPDLTQAKLESLIRGERGDLLQDFNSLESIAYHLIDSQFNGYDSLRASDILATIQLEDLIRYGLEYIPSGKWSHVIGQPF